MLKVQGVYDKPRTSRRVSNRSSKGSKFTGGYLMKFKIPYKCIIYEEGDIVFPKYPNEESKPMLIIGTRLDIIGHNTVTQFLKI